MVNREKIDDILVALYKVRLEDSTGGGDGAVHRMLEKDNDGGVKLRNRAQYYAPMLLALLDCTDIDVDAVTIKQIEYKPRKNK